MEAASTGPASLSTRDGAVPAAPTVPTDEAIDSRQPIDGVARCSCCERYPLVGEQVILHIGRKGAGWVCERCETTGRGDRAGVPAERVRVRSFGGAMNVRRAV